MEACMQDVVWQSTGQEKPVTSRPPSTRLPNEMAQKAPIMPPAKDAMESIQLLTGAEPTGKMSSLIHSFSGSY